MTHGLASAAQTRQGAITLRTRIRSGVGSVSSAIVKPWTMRSALHRAFFFGTPCLIMLVEA